jgi:hypothetical protein
MITINITIAALVDTADNTGTTLIYHEVVGCWEHLTTTNPGPLKSPQYTHSSKSLDYFSIESPGFWEVLGYPPFFGNPHIYIYIHTYICVYVYIYIFIHIHITYLIHLPILPEPSSWVGSRESPNKSVPNSCDTASPTSWRSWWTRWGAKPKAFPTKSPGAKWMGKRS